MKQINFSIVFSLSLAICTIMAQENNWAVYAIIVQSQSEAVDPCDIRYCILELDSLQDVASITTKSFMPIYQQLDHQTAARLRDLHCPYGANQPDQVVKFSTCTVVGGKQAHVDKGNLLKEGFEMAKKEFKKKGVLYFVGQGAKALADAGVIKDEKTNEILKSIGKIKVKIPIKSNKKNHKSRQTRKYVEVS